MGKGKCTSCGKPAINYGIKINKKLTLNLCMACSEKLTYKINGSHPMIWVGKSDLESHLPENVSSQWMNYEDLIKVKELMTETFWSNEYNGYTEMLLDCFKEVEESYIRRIPEEQLPLYINDNFSQSGKELISELLKKG